MRVVSTGGEEATPFNEVLVALRSVADSGGGSIEAETPGLGPLGKLGSEWESPRLPLLGLFKSCVTAGCRFAPEDRDLGPRAELPISSSFLRRLCLLEAAFDCLGEDALSALACWFLTSAREVFAFDSL